MNDPSAEIDALNKACDILYGLWYWQRPHSYPGSVLLHAWNHVEAELCRLCDQYFRKEVTQ